MEFIMQYAIGAILGLVAGIFLYVFWKKKFSKYLPDEDALLLKVICCVVYIFACLIAGALFVTRNKYAVGFGFILLILLFVVTYSFGLYYKVIATKKMKF